MTTLVEIESAAVSLPTHEKEELFRFLIGRLRMERATPPSGWSDTLGGITDETFVRPFQPRLDPVPQLK